jgi:cytochrome P450
MSTTIASHRQAPGPRGGLSLGMDLRRNGPRVLLDLAHRYGDVVRMRVGSRTMYLLNDAALAKHVFQDKNKNYGKSAGSRKVRSFLGDGLLTAEGDVWLRHRRMMQHAFTQEKIARLGVHVSATVNEVVERWRPLAERGETIDVHAEMMRLTLTVVSRALFSTDLGDRTEATAGAFRIAFDHTVRRMHSLIDVPDWVPTPANARFREAVRTLDDIFYAVLARRRSKAASTGDLLSVLMQARDEETGEALAERELRDEVLTLLLGGYDTAANSLSWMWYLLSKNPAIAGRLRADLAPLGGKAPTVEDLPQIPYAGMVFEEAMRLYPPVWVLAREAIEDDELNGYHVPAGSMILISPYVIHHDPRYWDNPEGFAPEHFAQDRRSERPRFAYLPFGGGPRQCLGMGLALLEARLIVATLAQHFRLDAVPWHRVDIVPSITLAPRGGMPMVVRPAPS